MKSFKIIITLFVVSLLYVSCDKEKTPPVYTDNLILGDWTVSSFLKNNNEIASQFAGYTFYCTENGGMSIQGNGKNYNCNWSNMNNNDSLFNFQIMGCGQNSPLYDCIDDWNLVSQDSLHCTFTSHNPDHHRTMTWDRKN
jgi:hypothetical protein